MRHFLSRRTYHHLNKIFISQAALKHNHHFLQQLQPQAQIAPVLKSNAYGHGLTTTAPIFDQLKPPFLIVDSLHEAYQLYKQKIKTPILIIGYTDPRNYQIKKLPFSYAIWDLDTARTLNQFQPGAEVHIFVDTGMNREGVLLSDLPNFLSELKKLNHLKIAGLTSHFADADNPKNQYLTKKQLKKYHRALELMQQAEIYPKWRHISASAGAFKNSDPIFNLVRAGIASYGITPLQKNNRQLQPALSLQTTLAQIKILHKRESVSYNATFTAKKEMKIGILPIGYYEGVDRRLSNQGQVKIKNQLCRIIGRVCMNITIIDLTQVKNPQVGDKVEIYSPQPDQKNAIFHQAKAAQTIPYKLLTGLAESIRREAIHTF